MRLLSDSGKERARPDCRSLLNCVCVCVWIHENWGIYRSKFEEKLMSVKSIAHDLKMTANSHNTIYRTSFWEYIKAVYYSSVMGYSRSAQPFQFGGLARRRGHVDGRHMRTRTAPFVWAAGACTLHSHEWSFVGTSVLTRVEGACTHTRNSAFMSSRYTQSSTLSHGPISNRPWPGSGPQPGGWRPLGYSCELLVHCIRGEKEQEEAKQSWGKENLISLCEAAVNVQNYRNKLITA